MSRYRGRSLGLEGRSGSPGRKLVRSSGRFVTISGRGAVVRTEGRLIDPGPSHAGRRLGGVTSCPEPFQQLNLPGVIQVVRDDPGNEGQRRLAAVEKSRTLQID